MRIENRHPQRTIDRPTKKRTDNKFYRDFYSECIIGTKLFKTFIKSGLEKIHAKILFILCQQLLNDVGFTLKNFSYFWTPPKTKPHTAGTFIMI